MDFCFMEDALLKLFDTLYFESRISSQCPNLIRKNKMSCFPHFTEEHTEFQGGYVTWPKTCSRGWNTEMYNS